VHFCQLCFAVDELVRRVAIRALWRSGSDSDVQVALAALTARLDETVLAVPAWVPPILAYMAPGGEMCCDRLAAGFTDALAAFGSRIARQR